MNRTRINQARVNMSVLNTSRLNLSGEMLSKKAAVPAPDPEPEPEGTYSLDFTEWWDKDGVSEIIGPHQLDLIGTTNSSSFGWTLTGTDVPGTTLAFTLNVSGLEAARGQYPDFELRLYTEISGITYLEEGDNQIEMDIPANAQTLFGYLRSATSISENGMSVVPLGSAIVIKEIPRQET